MQEDRPLPSMHLAKTDTSGVFDASPMSPILACLAAWACGMVASWALLPLAISHSPVHSMMLGAMPMLIGGGVVWGACTALVKTNVPILKLSPPRKLITRDVYSLSRNPMYVGLLLCTVGLSIACNTWWGALFAIPVALYLHFIVIPAEEVVLAKQHPLPWRQYVTLTPRWI